MGKRWRHGGNGHVKQRQAGQRVFRQVDVFDRQDDSDKAKRRQRPRCDAVKKACPLNLVGLHRYRWPVLIWKDRVLEEIGLRNNRWLDQEVAKLDRWSEDLKFGLEQEIKDLDQQIREAKRASSAAATLEDKLVHQRALKALQATRNQKRKDLFISQDEVESRRDALIADIEARMTKDQKEETLFRIRWSLK